MRKPLDTQFQLSPGLITLALRLVVGWTYFSAFWRRVALENKLDMDGAGYIGEKFNHFLPNALGIKPVIEYLVTHPQALWWAMVIFTIVEAVVGLFIMLGLFTRLMSLGVFGLAMGILLGSGWIGTTCLDEWQIGVLGVASGFVLFLSGSGEYSLDHYFRRQQKPFTRTRMFGWLGSGPMPVAPRKSWVGIGAVLILGLTLFTNQYFHGGVWGTLHNKSVKPKLEITGAKISDGKMQFQVYRTEGVDVYGSWLIGIRLQKESGETVFHLKGDDLAKFPKGAIFNRYVARVKPGKHSLVIPLGAKAVLFFNVANHNLPAGGRYQLTLTDISGAEWSSELGVMN